MRTIRTCCILVSIAPVRVKLNRDVAHMLRELLTHANAPAPPPLPAPPPGAFPVALSSASASASTAAPGELGAAQPGLLPPHQVQLLEPRAFAPSQNENPEAPGERMHVAIWSPPTPQWNAWSGSNIEAPSPSPTYELLLMMYGF